MSESNLQKILPETGTSQPYLPESTSKQLCYLLKRGVDFSLMVAGDINIMRNKWTTNAPYFTTLPKSRGQ